MVNRRQILVAGAGASMLAVEAMAQSPDPAYAVTYLEVAPGEVNAARRLLASYRDTAKGNGPLEFTVLEQVARPNHFVIIERWPNAKAREDNAGSIAGRTFRTALALLQIAPYDERPHLALSVGPADPAPAALYVVTHVDVVPPKRDDAVAELKTLSERSAGSAGNVRFDTLVQASRLNHMTLVESWTDAAAQEAHSVTDAAKSFRTALGPMSGALYDERLFTLLK
ncbi:MAG: antibiotic biosynthesis monooxygenase [Alphaproteobacteria bacterium]|nr:antibiotic biosynthesis monooxygenase [Alphaproteobacteria bacterium]MBV8413164.1 antibiotic biosynthesis monooxygenase [Alphaproteobacteria bacterium]